MCFGMHFHTQASINVRRVGIARDLVSKSLEGKMKIWRKSCRISRWVFFWKLLNQTIVDCCQCMHGACVCLRVARVSCKCCRVLKNASHASLFLLEERHLSEQSVLQSEVQLLSQRIANRRSLDSVKQLIALMRLPCLELKVYWLHLEQQKIGLAHRFYNYC